MEPHGVERRLTTILSADVAGYSRLVEADEEGTLAALKAHRDELIDPEIAEHRGRIVKVMGDGVLAEFASVVEAVACAVEIQREMARRNAEAPDGRRIDLRIGINLGDVVIEGDDLYGDGVNIAARVQELAEPGGVCISGSVHEQVERKTDLVFENMGKREVKNIDRPVRVWRWAPDAATAAPGSGEEPAALPLPDKPSIAVLPFDNMSGDPQQEYFADGITEDIITGLSRFHTLFVIARNSTFVYKGRGVRVPDVGRELGVRYVVEGSVRKSERRVRVNAQLVDAETGKHVWAERYDRDLDDIFAVQDEITQAVVSTLPGRLESAGWERAKRKRTANMTAYDYVLLGLERFNRFSRDDNLQARRMFQAAIGLDASYARAHALLASTYIWDLFIYAESDQSLDLAFEAAGTALTLDDEDGWSNAILGFALFLRGQDEEAEIQFRRAVSLNPNDADAIAFMANALTYLGQWEEALECIVKAKRINPFPPAYYHWYHALALYSAREYAQAIRAIKRIRSLDRWHHGLLAMCCAQLGRRDEAGAEIALFADARRKEIRDRGAPVPAGDLGLVLDRVNRYRVQGDREHFLEGLRKAGLNL